MCASLISLCVKMLTNWLCMQEWELAGCLSMLEELKKEKGGKEAHHFCQDLLMLLPD